MILNGKTFDKWTKEDIEVIMDNPDYRENEFIDYKSCFSFLEITDKEKLQKKKNEFRHDICSFANAEGGYIFFGIKENEGIPSQINGIKIDNTDKFELDRRNEINKISPVMPSVVFRFVEYEQSNYLVILKINKGFHIPYVCREDEDKYRFFVRKGNGKRAVSYNELRTMFNQSNSLSAELKTFRLNRIDEILDKVENQQNKYFAIIHIVPALFLESSTYVSPFLLQKEKRVNYPNIFKNCCYGNSIPNVDGLSFPNYEYDNGIALQIFNNNVIEKTIKLKAFQSNELNCKSLRTRSIFDSVSQLCQDAIKYYKELELFGKAYICVTIAGCKNLCTEYNFYMEYNGIVDRNNIVCEPVEIYDINDECYVQNAINKQKINVCLALGIKNIKKYAEVDI